MSKTAIEVITSVQRRRRWTAEEKERLVAASLEPGTGVSAVARQAGIQRLGGADDPGAEQRASMAGERPHRHAQGVRWSRLCSAFRGRRGGLIKVLWHDGQGMCLFAKRLERGRFVWPSTAPRDGAERAVTITPAQLGYLLEGIDWRLPQHTWRPQAAR
jgi:transposase